MKNHVDFMEGKHYFCCKHYEAYAGGYGRGMAGCVGLIMFFAKLFLNAKCCFGVSH